MACRLGGGSAVIVVSSNSRGGEVSSSFAAESTRIDSLLHLCRYGCASGSASNQVESGELRVRAAGTPFQAICYVPPKCVIIAVSVK